LQASLPAVTLVATLVAVTDVQQRNREADAMTDTLTAEHTQAVGYIRVSTRRQAETGTSLLTQPQQLRDYCLQRGLELVKIHTDAGLSGKDTKRPGLQAAMQQVQACKGTLVVPSLSRFGRNMADLTRMTEQLTKAGCRLVSVKEGIDSATPTGRLMLHMMGAMAEFERELLLDRLDEARGLKRERGEKLGGHTPLGFDAVTGNRGKLELRPNTSELKVLALVMQLREQGLGYHAVAAHLTAEKVPTKRGCRWNPKTVRDIVLRVQQDAKLQKLCSTLGDTELVAVA